ncbi:MAG: hypothetical protein IIU77_03250 [Clostridia bacterium]|nr:hypothetical protein [Clostridia bacterium]
MTVYEALVALKIFFEKYSVYENGKLIKTDLSYDAIKEAMRYGEYDEAYDELLGLEVVAIFPEGNRIEVKHN